MKNRLMTIAAAALLVATAASCEKTIDQELSGNERTLLELRIEGQMGKAITERDGDRATATVYILDQDDYDYAHVPVTGIVLSKGATSDVKEGDMLNFSNPERRARIRVTSASGHVLDWWIYLETYDPFYLGTWRIIDVKLACDQRVSGVGDGSWTTQPSGPLRSSVPVVCPGHLPRSFAPVICSGHLSRLSVPVMGRPRAAARTGGLRRGRCTDICRFFTTFVPG